MAKDSTVHEEIKEMFGQVPTWMETMPKGALPGFWALMRDVEFTDTALPHKVKELIGIGVAGATRCRYCALFHTEAARLFGASDEEIAEASMMAGLVMGASTFLNAMQADHDLFRKETLEMIDYVRRQTPRPTERRVEAEAHA